MRIIHTADLHLDSRLETNLDPIKAKERKRELLVSFENMIHYAHNKGVEAVLIAGDLFDRPRVSEKTKDYILGLIEDFSDIEFLYVFGNHDANCFMDTLDELPSNLHIFGNSFETRSYKDVEITAVSGEEHSDALYDTLLLNKSKLNIVMMHGDVNDKNSINLSLLKDKNIDYLALGHIHKYQRGRLDDRGIYVYSGCPEGRGFDEAGQKGFVVIDAHDGELSSEFVPFSKRVLHDISVDITNCETWGEIRKNVSLRLTEISSQDMVRIRLCGSYDLSLLKQTEMLDASLNQQYYFAKVSDESHLRINPKDYENEVSLKGEFIRNVLDSQLSEEDKVRVIEYGIKALMKEEI